MKILSVRSLAIPEILAIRFGRFRDDRGYFTEPYRASDFATHPDLGALRSVEFVQANESVSKAGVLRGLHFQWDPYVGKLVRTVRGRMVDIVLDIRRDSPTFGHGLFHDMPADDDADHGEWIWVPPGFAHGNFFTEPTRIEYFCTGEYSPGSEASISAIARDIDWSLAEPSLKAAFDRHVAGPALVSDKDRLGVSVGAWHDDPRSHHFVYRHLSA